MRYLILVLSGVIASFPAPTRAQEAADGLSLSGGMRLRYEMIDGQPRAGFDRRDALVNLRTNVLAEYRRQDVRLAVEFYDSRVWGDDPGTPISTNEVNALEPVQAYIAADLDGAFGKGTRLGLAAGRMTLNLGSRRLVAADDYRNTTNGYTGLRADIAARGGWKAVLIYMLPQMRLPDDDAGIRDARVRLDRESFDLVLWGGQVSRANAIGRATGELSYFHLGERDGDGRPTRDRSLDTFGGRLIAEPRAGMWDYEVEGFYQSGSISASLAPAAPRQRVAANFIHADIGYSFRGPWKLRLSAEFDRASGDRPGGKFGRFDTLFGMRRADLAPSGLYNAIGRSNIVTPGIRAEIAPGKRFDALAVYRALWLAADRDSFSTTGVRDPAGRSGRFAGHQVEARLRYWIIPERLRFEFDGVLLAKGRFLRDAPNAPAGRTARYASFNLMGGF